MRPHPFALATLGAAGIALGAQVTVPMVPVPMTLQTLAVVAAGLLGGPGLGAGAAAIYLALVLLGLPVLAEGGAHGGTTFFAQPTAGYVLGFIPGAAVAGLGRRGMTWPRRLGWSVAAGLGGHGVVLLLGTGMLAVHIGWRDAVVHGCLPFLAGAAAKSLAAAILTAGTPRTRT